MLNIIRKKRNGFPLSEEEIRFFIKNYVEGKIPDYQVSALMMAIYFQGMNFDETYLLTDSMLKSGKLIDLTSIPLPKVDKHSTGGVGDKVSLILAPLIASCDIAVPMISGRALGHTGGTLDKLESIPMLKTDIPVKNMINILKNVGMCIIGQSAELVPADRKLYSLRDATSTVESIPLISASIMSKKLAEGIDSLVLDVKVGSGAFMKDIKSARELAVTMVKLGKRMGKRVAALLTNMNTPLGKTVGNTIEVMETIKILRREEFPQDLMEVTFALGNKMLELANKEKINLKEVIKSGKPLEKFEKFIECVGGDRRVIDNPELLRLARYKNKVISPEDGYVLSMNTEWIGELARELGAGRKKMEDKIDPGVGFTFGKKTGDKVNKGNIIALVYSNDRTKGEAIGKKLLQCYSFGKNPPPPQKMILEVIE